jgi:glycosyltransferase involved in cell wall biosynthesis
MPRTIFVENWLVSRLADRVVAVSRAVGDALRRRGTSHQKLIIIPNGLITDTVDVPVPADTLDDWKRLIGWEPSRRTIGIIARWKDQGIVLRALQRVETPTRLVLAGVDPKLNLDPLVSQVPPRHAVVRLPFVAPIRPLYELLELILLPSRIEGLSQTLLEAMALRKPVIASAAGGNLELIRDRVDGRLVAPLDPAAWASVIEELLSSPAEAARLASGACHTARETYSLARTVERTSELYRSLLVPG